MAKRILAGILTVAMLAVAATGCGSNKTVESAATVQTSEDAGSEPAASDRTSGGTVQQESAGTETVVQETAAADPGEVPAEYVTEDIESYAEDGTLLYVASYTRPELTIAGNIQVQDKINAALKDMQAEFESQMTVYDEIANENYRDWKKSMDDTPGSYNNGYGKEKKWDENYNGYTVLRDLKLYYALSDFISIRQEGYEFLGGANGTTTVKGITFSAMTGDSVGLKDIFPVDTDATLTFISNKILEKLKSVDYEGYLMDDYMDYIGSFASEEDGDNWYLSEEGFVAVIQESTALAHVVGPVEITVPWTELVGYM